MYKSRINRATYWFHLGVLMAVIAAVIYFTDYQHMPFVEIALILICVPRLHDLGRSGWWVGGLIIAEAVTVLSALLTVSEDVALLLTGGFWFLYLIGIVVLGIVPGQAGPNRFGPPPGPGLSSRRVEGPEKAF